ncbi:hypothetical protein DAI22_01g218401 [Oryza sativa Japonica Group]|nr:hypothetical protein DAI22_01g218401 [Oryza sativa Japonica Group]
MGYPCLRAGTARQVLTAGWPCLGRRCSPWAGMARPGATRAAKPAAAPPFPSSPRLAAARAAAGKAGQLQRRQRRGSPSPSLGQRGWGDDETGGGSTAPATMFGSRAGELGSGPRLAAANLRGAGGMVAALA